MDQELGQKLTELVESIPEVALIGIGFVIVMVVFLLFLLLVGVYFDRGGC